MAMVIDIAENICALADAPDSGYQTDGVVGFNHDLGSLLVFGSTAPNPDTETDAARLIRVNEPNKSYRFVERAVNHSWM
jgi:hypothetical protein